MKKGSKKEQAKPKEATIKGEKMTLKKMEEERCEKGVKKRVKT